MRATALLALAVAASSSAVANDWTFNARPYLWFAGMGGSLQLPGGPTADFSQSFSDIWSNLNFGGMLAVEGNQGKYGFVTDFVYVDQRRDGEFTNQNLVRGTLKTFSGTFLGEYILMNEEGRRVGALLGIRYVSAEGRLRGNAGGGLLDLNGKANWVDPQLGVRGSINTGKGWTADGSVLVALKQHVTWDLQATVGYRLSNTTSLSLGYRYLSLYRDSGSIRADVSLQGPTLGADFRF